MFIYVDNFGMNLLKIDVYEWSVLSIFFNYCLLLLLKDLKSVTEKLIEERNSLKILS